MTQSWNPKAEDPAGNELLGGGEELLDAAEQLLTAGEELLGGGEQLLGAGEELLGGGEQLLPGGEELRNGGQLLVRISEQLLGAAEELLTSGVFGLSGLQNHLHSPLLHVPVGSHFPDRAQGGPGQCQADVGGYWKAFSQSCKAGEPNG